MTEATGKHYSFDYKGVRFDPYRLFDLYKISHPAQQHAIKKLLRAGQSVKSLKQDIEETIMTLQRWQAMIEEDEVKPSTKEKRHGIWEGIRVGTSLIPDEIFRREYYGDFKVNPADVAADEIFKQKCINDFAGDRL